MGLKAVIVVAGATSGSSSGSSTISPSSLFYIAEIDASAPNTQELPPAPANNQIIVVQDAGNNAGTNTITIDGNGNDIIVPNLGVEANVTISGNGESLWFNWIASVGVWGILA